MHGKGNTMAGISIKTDPETKKQFSKFCDDVGMTVSGAINLFMKTTVRENRIPFEIKGEAETNDECDSLLRDFESKRDYPGFGTAEELFDDEDF